MSANHNTRVDRHILILLNGPLVEKLSYVLTVLAIQINNKRVYNIVTVPFTRKPLLAEAPYPLNDCFNYQIMEWDYI